MKNKPEDKNTHPALGCEELEIKAEVDVEEIVQMCWLRYDHPLHDNEYALIRNTVEDIVEQGYLTKTPVTKPETSNAEALAYLDKINYGWWADKEHPVGKAIRAALSQQQEPEAEVYESVPGRQWERVEPEPSPYVPTTRHVDKTEITGRVKESD